MCGNLDIWEKYLKESLRWQTNIINITRKHQQCLCLIRFVLFCCMSAEESAKSPSGLYYPLLVIWRNWFSLYYFSVTTVETKDGADLNGAKGGLTFHRRPGYGQQTVWAVSSQGSSWVPGFGLGTQWCAEVGSRFQEMCPLGRISGDAHIPTW